MAPQSTNSKKSTLMPLLSAASQPPSTPKYDSPLPNNTLFDFIQSIIVNKQENKEPFYVLDLGVVASLMNRWTRNLPNIRPFYAVKCNPDASFLSAMAAHGSNFDCASRAEIEAVLSLGVSPDCVIFANPCKPVPHIKYAAEVGVNLTTFDSEFEVLKIRKHHPNCELLIRIKAPDDGDASFPLSKKYGALPEEVEPLLRAAQAAQLPVVGVSFHIGSGARRADAYRTAIEAARKVFDTAAHIGLSKLRLLNLGGGFTSRGQLFEAAAETINAAVTEYFGGEPGLTVMAEPGRFFAESVFTLATNIIGKRVRGEVREYWINDGIHGSMNFRYFQYVPLSTPFACMSRPENLMCHGEMTYKSTVFGPTCDASDVVFTEHQLPELQLNDWLIIPNMGSYTRALASYFNGFNPSTSLTYVTYSKPT
ncbi:ornithine decarboxylase-like [Sesamum indicum]|uniref:ornithine decarboxylase n=1 Tax=Sesamum indicum TaxID=4182 RepID=A0A6I9TJZ9_SESIN|nr:ornithine decarboxylase-like [Sesamum indicum]